MSSISCACDVAFWRMTVGRALHGVAIVAALAEHVRPAHDRVQRRAQLVRERGEEFVLQPVGALGFETGRLLAAQQLHALPLDLRALLDLGRQRDVGVGQLAGALGDASTRALPARCAAPPGG